MRKSKSVEMAQGVGASGQVSPIFIMLTYAFLNACFHSKTLKWFISMYLLKQLNEACCRRRRGILSNRPYGVRPGSCTDAITDFLSKVSPYLVDSDNCLSVYLDLSEALDTCQS